MTDYAKLTLGTAAVTLNSEYPGSHLNWLFDFQTSIKDAKPVSAISGAAAS